MISAIPTAFLFFAASLLLLVLPKNGALRPLLLLAVPVIAAVMIWTAGLGNFAQISFFGFELEFMRLDPLSRVFVLVFCVAAFLANLFAWHVRDTVQQVAALLYAGSAIGAVLAGDLVTLFFYWEGTAIASVFLIWARGTEGAYWAGMRYLIIQITSGVILLAGVVLWYHETGSIAFGRMTLGSLATWLMFIAFGIKCAFPLLHNWLQDSYPSATVTGAVILSVFTTKMAVYTLARGFPGTEALVYIGAIMALFPIGFALIENDLRRTLAYSLNSQLGFMVVGVGIGTELAISGAAAHAVASVFYKGLLFMAVGAVMFRTGTARASDLGGLYRTMPLTAVFCLVGALAISSMPLISGFVTKALVLDATASEHYEIVWLLLLTASVGAIAHTGIKIPLYAFFGTDSGRRPAEAPRAMLWAMGLSAVLCILIGLFPQSLYAILPYPVEYAPYTTGHVVGQMQLILLSLVAFVFLYRTKVWPQRMPSVNLNFDWVYRRALPVLVAHGAALVAQSYGGLLRFLTRRVERALHRLYRSHGPEGRMASNWPTGAMVLSIALLLGATLLVNFAG